MEEIITPLLEEITSNSNHENNNLPQNMDEELKQFIENNIFPVEYVINGYKVIDYNNIFVIENILDDELCDKLKTLILTLPTQKIHYADDNNVECYITTLYNCSKMNDNLFYEFSVKDDRYKKLLQNISEKKLYNNNLNGYTKEDIKKYILLLDYKGEVIGDIIKHINPHISFKFNCGYMLRKIFGPTLLHIDSLFSDKLFNIIYRKKYNECIKINMNTNIVRNASAIFTLNDDYDGGLFCFPKFNLSLKLKKGSVIVFPPYWTHAHYTTELLNNTFRYTITTWYGENLDENFDKRSKYGFH
jgi:hypothetical protein